MFLLSTNFINERMIKMMYILPENLVQKLRELERTYGQVLAIRIAVDKYNIDDNMVTVDTWNSEAGTHSLVTECLEDENTEILVEMLRDLLQKSFTDVNVITSTNYHYFNE